jgi:hypothetical protein
MANWSEEPVSSVVVYYVWVQGAAWHTGEEAEQHLQARGDLHDIRALVLTLPPKGKFHAGLKGPDNSPMQGQLGLEMAFTDAGGQSWIRRASGKLEPIDGDPLAHYGIAQPVDYDRLVAAD